MYIGPLHFTVTSIRSTQHQFLEFKKQTFFSKKTICMVNLHTDTVNILTEKCGSCFFLVFLGFIHIAMNWKQKVWWGKQDSI